MEILGPKYPFEPLPPPDDLPMRNLAGQKKAEPSTEKISEPERKGTSFKNVLREKTQIVENPAETSDEITKLRKAAQDFESFFIYSILKNFNSSSMDGGLFPKTPGRDMYMDMFFQGVSEEMAKRPGGLGLADLIIDSVKATLTPKGQ